MMPKRWHHGHSMIAGSAVGFSITYRPWLILAAGIVIGAIAVVAALGGYKLGRTLLGAFEAWRDQSKAKRETIQTGLQPVYSLRTRRGPSNDVPF